MPERLLQETHDAVVRLETNFENHLRHTDKILERLDKHDELLRGDDGRNGICGRLNNVERWMKSIKALWTLVVGAIVAGIGNWWFGK